MCIMIVRTTAACGPAHSSDGSSSAAHDGNTGRAAPHTQFDMTARMAADRDVRSVVMRARALSNALAAGLRAPQVFKARCVSVVWLDAPCR